MGLRQGLRVGDGYWLVLIACWPLAGNGDPDEDHLELAARIRSDILDAPFGGLAETPCGDRRIFWISLFLKTQAAEVIADFRRSPVLKKERLSLLAATVYAC